MATLTSSGFGSLFGGFSARSFGNQASWAIDPVNGDDSFVGTPAKPLRTMAEFNARMQGVFVQVAQTLQLVGDVTDQHLNLFGTRYKLNCTLTVSGTRTQIGTGAITTVTAIGQGATTFPFQLTTTGVDWTSINSTAPGAQIQLQGGQICFIKSVVDANNVVVGAMTALSSATLFTPTNGLTFTVFSLSRALPALVNVSAQSTGSIQSQSLILQHMSFDGGLNWSFCGAGVLIQGCEIKTAVTALNIHNLGGDTLVIRSCRFTPTQVFSVRAGAGRVNLTACVLVASALSNLSMNCGQDYFLSSLSFHNVALFLAASSTALGGGGAHFEGVTSGSAVTLTNNATLLCSGTGAVINGRLCSGSGFGIDVSLGRLAWNTSANKPTLGIAAGLTGDARLGSGGTAVTFTYAALGTGKQTSFTDAAPNTTTQLNGGGGAAAFQVG